MLPTTTPFLVPGYVTTGYELAVMSGLFRLNNYPGNLPCTEDFTLYDPVNFQGSSYAVYQCAEHEHTARISQATIRAMAGEVFLELKQ